MFAALNGHFEILKFLIENNADVNLQNKVFLKFIIISYNSLKFFF
jgi:ankyrin repeat protein